MRPSAPLPVLATLALLAALPARAGDCNVEVGPNDRVSRGESLVVRSGAWVKQDAVAIGGDVVVESDARVGNDAVSLGGQVREVQGSKVKGSVIGLAFQGGKSSLAREILKGISSLEGCQVVTKGATGG